MRILRDSFPFTLIVLIIAVSSTTTGQSSRENRELKMADQAVLASIAVSRSPKGKQVCVQNELACVGADKAELGLALIGSKNTAAGRSALTNLLGYRLDGSVAEDYSCYVLKAGAKIKQQLLNVKVETLAGRCKAALETLSRSRKTSFEGLDFDAVCADPGTIRTKVKELLEGLNKGTKCSTEDF